MNNISGCPVGFIGFSTLLGGITSDVQSDGSQRRKPRGEGGPRQYGKALELFANAAHRGDDTAKNNIGTMFLKGLGVSRDLVRAHVWFNLVAAHGEPEAVRNRDKVARMMTPKDIQRAKRTASKLQRHFQQRGESSALPF